MSDRWFDDEPVVAMSVSQAQPAPLSRGRRNIGSADLGYAAAVATVLSLFVPWYSASIRGESWDVGATSPWLLGFIAVVWSGGVAAFAALLRREKAWVLGTVGLIAGGLLIVGQVAVFVAVKSIFGWVAKLANTIGDSGTVESSVGFGAYLQVLAGLLAIASGLSALSPRLRRGRNTDG